MQIDGLICHKQESTSFFVQELLWLQTHRWEQLNRAVAASPIVFNIRHRGRAAACPGARAVISVITYMFHRLCCPFAWGTTFDPPPMSYSKPIKVSSNQEMAVAVSRCRCGYSSLSGSTHRCLTRILLHIVWRLRENRRSHLFLSGMNRSSSFIPLWQISFDSSFKRLWMSVYTNNEDAAAFSSAPDANARIPTTKKIKLTNVF